MHGKGDPSGNLAVKEELMMTLKQRVSELVPLRAAMWVRRGTSHELSQACGDSSFRTSTSSARCYTFRERAPRVAPLVLVVEYHGSAGAVIGAPALLVASETWTLSPAVFDNSARVSSAEAKVRMCDVLEQTKPGIIFLNSETGLPLLVAGGDEGSGEKGWVR